jgi:hypothetical protein
VGWDAAVPEYDAFGREIGADPLAALRDATVAEPRREPVAEPRPDAVAEPRPELAAEPIAAEPVVARPRRVRSRRRGLLLTPIIALGLLVAAVGMFAGVAVDRIESGLEDAIVEPEPAGLGPDSMLRARNLAAVLDLVQSSWKGRPLTVVVTPNRVDVRLVGPEGRRAFVRFVRGNGLRTRPLPGRGGTGIPYSRINATIPERLVREDPRRIRFVRLDRDGWEARFR